MNRLFRCAAIAAGLALSAAAGAAQANLLTNGSFEGCPSYARPGGGSSEVSGWTTTGDGVEWFAQSGGYPARDGSCIVDLAWYTSSGVPGGGIMQSVLTSVGHSYSIDFFGVTHKDQGRDGTALIELWLNGTLANTFSVTNTSPTWTLATWQGFSHTFTATSATTVVQFRNQQNAYEHFAYIDGLSMAASAPTVAPEPVSLALLGTGLAGVAAARRRRRRGHEA